MRERQVARLLTEDQNQAALAVLMIVPRLPGLPTWYVLRPTARPAAPTGGSCRDGSAGRR
jgi:hypothetical protein